MFECYLRCHISASCSNNNLVVIDLLSLLVMGVVVAVAVVWAPVDSAVFNPRRCGLHHRAPSFLRNPGRRLVMELVGSVAVVVNINYLIVIAVIFALVCVVFQGNYICCNDENCVLLKTGTPS